MSHRLTILLIFALALLAAMLMPYRAHAQLQAPTQTPSSEVAVTSPVSSQTVSGTVQIIGTAIDPNFRHYELSFAPDPPVGDAWFAIQPPIAQQIREGILGVWDTTFVDDGRYIVRLRVFRNDGTIVETLVRVLVSNATPTPTSTLTPTATATPTPGPGGPTAGPTLTPLIWQPPTRTPRPAPTPGGPAATPIPAGLGDAPFRPERLRQAACTGTQITLVVFGLLALYGMGRAAIRGQLRTMWWQFRREVINPPVDSLVRKRRRKKRS